MTLDTVGIEKVLTDSLCFRIFSHLINRHFGKLSIHLAVFLFGFGNLFFILTVASPAPDTFKVTDTRIHDQIADTEGPSADIQPKPPTRQRVVVFFNTVPFMTCRFDFFALFRTLHNVLGKQQPCQADKAEHDNNCNVYIPEIAGKLGCCVHSFAP